MNCLRLGWRPRRRVRSPSTSDGIQPAECARRGRPCRVPPDPCRLGLRRRQAGPRLAAEHRGDRRVTPSRSQIARLRRRTVRSDVRGRRATVSTGGPGQEREQGRSSCQRRRSGYRGHRGPAPSPSTAHIPRAGSAAAPSRQRWCGGLGNGPHLLRGTGCPRGVVMLWLTTYFMTRVTPSPNCPGLEKRVRRPRRPSDHRRYSKSSSSSSGPPCGRGVRRSAPPSLLVGTAVLAEPLEGRELAGEVLADGRGHQG